MQDSNHDDLVSIRRLNGNDLDRLYHYLKSLSPLTRSRFGPHSFELGAIETFYHEQSRHIGFVAVDRMKDEFIGYAIVKIGFLPHDQPRLESYGLHLDDTTDASFAPSVADRWQGKGIGQQLFQYILTELRALHIRRIILWGGVQSANIAAVKYYQKQGFTKLGSFYYNGDNDDMVLYLNNITI